MLMSATIDAPSFAMPRAADISLPTWVDMQAVDVRPAFVTPRPANGIASGESPIPDDPQLRAQAEAEQQLANAMAIAEQEGRDRGEEDGRQRWQERIASLEAIVNDLQGVRDDALLEAKEDVVQLSVAIARAILERDLRGDTAFVQALFDRALEMVKDGGELKVHVSVADEPVIAEAIRDREMQNQKLKIVADESIEAGCIVESKTGRVDATVENRLRNIARALLAKAER